MMTSPVDQLYFKWLCEQIEFPRGLEDKYHGLLERLHNYEFSWTVLGDDNRVQDAHDLRRLYVDGPNERFYENNFKPYVSVLEIIIALSRRLEFLAGGVAPAWAWRLIENLRLNRLQDPIQGEREGQFVEIMDALIWRTYDSDGTGGFFPLNYPTEDQTRVELWYQMNAYVSEIQQ